MLRRDVQIIEHVCDYCDDIVRYVESSEGTFDRFMADQMCQHSIAFCIMQIGELVGKLSAEMRSATASKINWSAIKGMRNIVVHDYGNVDQAEVWHTATMDIPILKAFCESYLAEAEKDAL